MPTREQAKAHLKVEHDEDDDLIDDLIAAVLDHLDAPNGWLGRAIKVQPLTATFDSFGTAPIKLPFPPLISITSVKYLDQDGVEQTIPSTDYAVEAGALVPAWGKAWPTPAARAGAVRITFSAGYAAEPPALQRAMLLMIGDLYAFRETAVVGTITSQIQMSTTVERLLAPFRVWPR